MSREWKPGDVATVEGEGSAWVAIVRVSSAPGRPLEFAYGNGGFDYVNDVALGFDARPLVVIDPENYQSLLSMVQAMEVHRPGQDITAATDRLQDHLRSLANPKPPRPDEPKGLGAVVEDEEGVRWVRDLNRPRAQWIRAVSAPERDRRNYADISAVRVLSPGVVVDK